MYLAWGYLPCRQCHAKSKRTKNQCRQPAMRGKAVCFMHGGRNKGPVTAEGKARIAAAHLVHGRETRRIRAERSKKLAELADLEELATKLGLIK